MPRSPSTTTRRALLVTTVALRLWYGGMLWYAGSETWFAEQWVGPWMRFEVVLTILAVGALVAAALLRRDVVLWLACIAALFILALPGARIGLPAMQLLPWVAASTLCLAFVVAWELSAQLAWLTVGLAVLGGAALPLAVAWGAIDFYIAAVVTGTAVLLLMMTLPSAAADQQTGPPPD